MQNLAHEDILFFNDELYKKTFCMEQIHELSNSQKENALVKVCNDFFAPENQNKKMSEEKVVFLENINRIHRIEHSRKGESMYTFKDSDNVVSKFVSSIINNEQNVCEKFKILTIYTFYKKREAWFVTDKITTDNIIEFDDISYEILKVIDDEIIPVLVGKDELTTENIPKYNDRIEV